MPRIGSRQSTIYVQSPRVRQERARTQRVFLALLVLLVMLGGIGVGFAFLQTDGGVFFQQKYFALRARVQEMLPRSTQPEFVPPPLTAAVFTDDPTSVSLPSSVVRGKDVRNNERANETQQQEAAQLALESGHAPTTSPQFSLPPSVYLQSVKWEAQWWNNCGPATLGMYLSYYGRDDGQRLIAPITKPDPEDKNVSPNELAAYAERIGMRTLIRENGTLDQMKAFLANEIPVMIETAFDPPRKQQGWMGHYKLLVGYDDAQFTFMDSYNGPDQKISFQQTDNDWRAFNRLYFVVYPADREATVREIVGADWDDRVMYENAAHRARDDIQANSGDAFAYFNLGTSLNGLEQFEQAAAAFDQARLLKIPWRMMWYQFGVYRAYYETKRYDEILALADATLRGSDNLEESHYSRGLALVGLGRDTEARAAFEAALRYNKNFRPAQDALDAWGS
ncbi:MAG: C39 family peptidase [Anaerolineae bacterium]|nr:C39 family peptidase [Anaerolineae bacterium]